MEVEGMTKVEIGYLDLAPETIRIMSSVGLLLVSNAPDGKPNVMAIGWGTVGQIWGKPIFIVMVRPSRYTHGCIEASNEFTVNVPPQAMKDVVNYCGTVSGRERDKFAEADITPAPGKRVSVPIISECIVHYECRVVHKNEIIPAALSDDIISTAYPQGDCHTVYFGEIITAYADEDASKKLRCT
ncbi:MAG TPA: flavin reductase family protein [Armatimonadetes bacterium]|nr:flavin reductase family protein [Armatimonadota bacterium]